MMLSQISFLYTFGLLFFTVRQVAAFDRDVCLQSAQWLLGNHTLSPDDPFFYRDTPNSPPYIDASNMTLTLAGCNAICGPEQTWYADVGPRLSAWLIPVLLLLINVEVSPLGKRSLLELLHLLGDPIDSLWSLIDKIDAWDRCYSHIARYKILCPSCRLVIATVLAGHEEVQGPRITLGSSSLESILEQYNLVNHFTELRRAAVHLADSRTDELVRTVLAFTLYLYQLVSNFVPAVGGVPTSPAGSRIAAGLLLSCCIPAILLTNTVGCLVSRRSAYSIMAGLTARTSGQTLHVADRHSFLLQGLPPLAQVSTSDYQEALTWSGGVYMYRPWKASHITWSRSHYPHTFMYGLLATTPVIIGFLSGSLLLWWQTPRGFNCRHIWLISVSLAWIASAVVTSVTYHQRFATGKYHWRFVLIKDAFVAIPSFLMFFLSASGLFNSCWCWSGPWEYPGKGRVILPVSFYESDGTIMYPLTLAAALLLQLFIVAYIVFHWRRGLRLLRWSERSRQEESRRILSGSEQCGCISNMQKERQGSIGSGATN